MLFNAKSSPHGKTKRQNRRAAHMERQRAPPKGREAENGSRGIDSRGRIPERLRRCNEVVSIFKNMALCGLPVKKVWEKVREFLTKYTDELPDTDELDGDSTTGNVEEHRTQER